MIKFLFILITLLKKGAASLCSLLDESSGLCYWCGIEYYKEDQNVRGRIPFPQTQCMPKTFNNINIKLFVYFDGVFESGDGSIERPFKRIEDAFNHLNELSSQEMRVECLLVLLLKENMSLVWNNDWQIDFFRRSFLKLTIKPGLCTDFPGISGCIKTAQSLRVLLKSSSLRLFVSDTIKLENIIFDGRDLVLPKSNQCILDQTLTECCDDISIATVYDKLRNPCGIYGRASIEDEKQASFFNIEMIHDSKEAIVPLLILKNVTFQNFQPFGDSIAKLFSLVENIQGSLDLNSVKIINSSFLSGLVGISRSITIGETQFTLKPLTDINTSQFSLSLENTTLLNINNATASQLNIILFDFHLYKGAILIKNIIMRNVILAEGCVFFQGVNLESSRTFDLIIDSFILAYSVMGTFLQSGNNLLIFISRGIILENEINTFILVEITPILIVDEMIISGMLPAEAFVSVLHTQVYIKNCNFFNLTVPFEFAAPVLFLSRSYFPISLSDQFKDGYFNNSFTAKDSFSIFNLNITDTDCEFYLISCYHSVLEVRLSFVHLINLKIRLKRAFIYAPVEKNFTIEFSKLENITVNQLILRLQPCIRLLISNTIFKNLLSEENYLLYFESRTTSNKSTHIFSLKGITLEDIRFNFRSDGTDFERYVIFSDHRSMGDGGYFWVVDSKIKNVLFGLEDAKSIILALYCVHIYINNIIIDTIGNCSVIYFSMTSDGSSFELTNMIFTSEVHPMHLFMNTEKDYIHTAIIINCTLKTKLVRRGSLFLLNNVKNLTFGYNYFRAAMSPLGSILIVRIEYLSKGIILENTFEGIPELQNTETIAILFATNKKDNILFNNKNQYGIINTTFRNLSNSAVIVAENSEILLVNATFSNFSSSAGPLIVIKSQSFAIVSKIFTQRVLALYDGGLFFILSSTLIVIDGVFNITQVYSGQGGTLFAKESDITLKNIFIFKSGAILGGLFMSESCNVIINGILILDSYANSSAGVIYAFFGTLKIENMEVAQSYSKSRGGFLLSDFCIVMMRNVTIKDSIAIDLGILLIFNEISYLSFLEDVRFINNKAKNLPTIGVFDTIVTCVRIYMFNNSADPGEWIAEVYSFTSICSFKLIEAKFEKNLQNGPGNLVFVKGSNFTVQGSFFLEKNALLFILADQSSTVELSKCFFKQSETQIRTGTACFLSLKKSSLIVNQTVFIGAQTLHVLNCVQCTNVDIKETTLNDCLGRDGTLFIRKSSYINIINCVFDNVHGQNFAAMRVENFESFNVIGALFVKIGCSVEGCAGAIFLKNDHLNSSVQVYLADMIFSGVLSTALVVTSLDISLKNCIFLGNQLRPSQALRLTGMSSAKITGTIFFNFIYFGACAFTSPSKITQVSNALEAQNKLYIYNSTYFNCSSSDSGGAIKAIGESTILISNSYFLNCYANISGGAIYYNCEGSTCQLKIEGPGIFSHSLAKVSGGAIQTLTGNNFISNDILFFENTAFVGGDTGSNPLKFILKEFDNESAFFYFREHNVSSLTINSSIKEMYLPNGHNINLGVFLLDSFGNYLRTISDFVVRTNISYSEKLKLNMRNGNCILKNGSCLLRDFSMISDIFNISFELKVFFNFSSSIKLIESVVVNVMECPLGEVFLSGRCVICEENFFSNVEVFSLNKNTAICEICPENAFCPGGYKIIPYPGYWRIDNTSKLILKCINKEACVYADDKMDKIACSRGYTGNTCYYCKEGFGKSSNTCTECFRTKIFWTTLLIGVLLFLGSIEYTRFTILKDEKSNEEEEMESDLLLKLLFNHFSYLSCISTFDLNWKDEIINIFNFFNTFITSSPQSIFVLDCFFEDSPIEKYRTTFLFICLSPLTFMIVSYLFSFLIEVVGLIFSSVRNIRHFKTIELMRRIKLMIARFFLEPKIMIRQFETLFVIICLNIYPLLCLKLVEVFICNELAENVTYMIANPDLECWSRGHFSYMILSLVFILLWGVGIPIYFLVRAKIAVKFLKNYPKRNSQKSVKTPRADISPPRFQVSPKLNQKTLTKVSSNFLFKNTCNKNEITVEKRNQNLSESSKILKKFSLFIVSGYEEHFYFWEAVMFFKKALIVSVSVFVNYLDTRSITGLIIFFLFAFFSINESRPIYKSTLIKEFEGFSLLITIATVSLSLFSSNEEIKDIPKLLSLVLVAFLNMVFLCVWFKAFITTSKYSKARTAFFTSMVSIFKNMLSRLKSRKKSSELR